MGTETQRVTVRLPIRDIEIMDALVETGEYTSRTAVIRRAIRDFLQAEGQEIAKRVKGEQDLTQALQQMQQMQEQIEAQREMLEKYLHK